MPSLGGAEDDSVGISNSFSALEAQGSILSSSRINPYFFVNRKRANNSFQLAGITSKMPMQPRVTSLYCRKTNALQLPQINFHPKKAPKHKISTSNDLTLAFSTPSFSQKLYLFSKFFSFHSLLSSNFFSLFVLQLLSRISKIREKVINPKKSTYLQDISMVQICLIQWLIFTHKFEEKTRLRPKK